MIRFIFLNAFIGLCTIIVSILVLLLSLIDGSGRLVHRYCAVPWAKMILRACGVRVEVKGLENVKRGAAQIFMVNHQSIFDIFALLATLPVDFKFILKQELMRIPILGFSMRRARYIGIDRENPRSAIRSMNEAARGLEKGVSVVIFPEGTRSEDGRLQEFKPGGFHLAIRSRCDIVPIAIEGSRNITPKGSLKINKGRFSMKIGGPISVKEYSKRDMDLLMQEARRSIISQMGGEQ
ncbi:MAG: 1-acyl-sn-glycerol-3-phosphate acyltransferase [Deltaproteobacteria bacterium]|nr:1-acyl-sn-glycerol-3-phosphate acyltransferase [Deltaproteobacteria bacterium]